MGQRKTEKGQGWSDSYLYRKSHASASTLEDMSALCRYFTERYQTHSKVSRFQQKCSTSSLTVMSRAKQVAPLDMGTIVSDPKPEAFIDLENPEGHWMNSVFFFRPRGR